MLNITSSTLLEYLNNGYYLMFNEFNYQWCLVKENYHNTFDESRLAWIKVKDDDTIIILEPTSTKSNVEALLNLGKIQGGVFSNDNSNYIYKYTHVYVDTVKERRMQEVANIIKHNDILKTNISTLIFLLSTMTDKEISEFHTEFLKRQK